MADQGDKPTDGNAKQWDRLQEMRRKSGTALTKEDGTPNDGATQTAEQRATAEAIKAEQEKLQAGEPVGGDEGDDDEGDDEPETPAETVTVREHERKKPEPKEKVAAAPEETPPPGTEFVEIDGKKVAVDASLAAAFRESETAKVDESKTADRQQLVNDIVSRVTSALPKTETPADTAATTAIKVAEAPLKNPYPDEKLFVTDPTEFNRQLNLHIDEKSERAAAKALADRDAKVAAENAANQQANVAREIAAAREQLNIQFYRQFKVLDDADVKPFVDVLLNKKIDEVIASGVLEKPMTPKEREALRTKTFNDTAAAATRQIVKLRGKSTTAEVTPAPALPNLVTSASNKGPKKPAPAPEAKPKEKYPSGSVSAMLAKHKSAKEGRSTAA